MSLLKRVSDLQIPDLKAHPVWEFVDHSSLDETLITPTHDRVVSSFEGRIIGSRVLLAGGALVWATLGNIDVDDLRCTQHFLTIAVERMGQWFSLARYHDLNFDTHNPDALARFLGMNVDQVFPISYDVSEWLNRTSAATRGMITKEPRERLTAEQIIALAVG